MFTNSNARRLAAGGTRQRGATMIEYVLIVAVISILGFATAAVLGPSIAGVFTTANTTIGGAAGGGGGTGGGG